MIIEERLPIGTIEQDVLEGKLSNQFLTANITDISIKGILENEQAISGTLNEIQVLNGEINNGESGSTPVLQDKSVSYNPTKITQNTTIRADSGYDGLNKVAITVNSIPGEYIIPSGVKNINTNGVGIDVTNYAAVDVAVPTSEPILQTKSAIPTELAQIITADSGYDGLDQVNISAISSTYIGSNIIRRSSSDLTISGGTITAPSGYYTSSVSATVQSGTAGMPTATKGSVSNHSVSITPSVTNTTGYITGGTLTGTAVTVSASELVSGTQTITTNGTVDVTNLSEVIVDVSGGTVSGDRILNAEGTYDVSSLATATYIYPALVRAYINVSNYYWAYYNDSSTSFCFEVQPNKRYTLTWDDTITFNLYRIGFTKSRHYPSTSSTGTNYRRNIYDASGERGIEQNGFVRSVSFTPSEGLVLCVVQIEGTTNDWNDGNIFSYFIDKMKHLTITVE